MEGVRSNQSNENSRDDRRTGRNLETLPDKNEPSDLGSRGATRDKLENQEWFTGPKCILNESQWPDQPELVGNKETNYEYKATELIFFSDE